MSENKYHLDHPAFSDLPRLADRWQEASQKAKEMMVSGKEHLKPARVLYYNFLAEGSPIHQLFFVAGLSGKREPGHHPKGDRTPRLICVKKFAEHSHSTIDGYMLT